MSGLADSADLIVLGAYFGSGNYGGMLSIFLVGVYDKKEKVFLTVCKVYLLFPLLSHFFHLVIVPFVLVGVFGACMIFAESRN